MHIRHRHILLVPVLMVGLSLAACDTIYPPTPQPDYTVHVKQTKNGAIAVPPECASWSKDLINPYDEQPLPQFGCANQRNLAMMIERPEDLVHGRPIGPANSYTTVGAQRRYTASQTRGLLDMSTAADMAPAATTSSSASSAINGDTPYPAGGASGGTAPAAAP